MWRRKSAKGDLVHSISLAEFNIDVGNTLTTKYPSSFKLEGYTDEKLANLCLPDGAHLHDEDWTYMRIVVPADKKSDSDSQPDTKTLWGMAYYRNKKDAKEKRGYIQKALLIISPYPYFNVFLPLLRLALTRHLEKKDNGVAKVLHQALNKSLQKQLQISLWGDDYPINVPSLRSEDEFGGTSLVDLVSLLKEDTMLLWYALLLGKKILFVGQPAHSVCNCVISAPLLVAPMVGFAGVLFPYVSLYDTSFTEECRFVAGATNMLFEMQSGWADFTASFSTGSVVHSSSIRITGSDRTLIKNVLSGIRDNKGEAWVREQFRNYTTQFLSAVNGDSTMKSQHKRYLPDFANTSPLWGHHVAGGVTRQRASTAAAGPLEFLRALKDPETPILQRTKAFYHLDRLLDNLSVVEEVLHADGLDVVVPFLTDESSQVRKYAVSVLAQLAISVEGQMSLVFKGLVGTVVEMLQDPMPNVASAACNCLYKMSTLYIGVLTLINHDVQSKLVDVIRSEGDNLNLKHTAAKALLQMYRLAPTMEPLEAVPFYEQLAIPDRAYRGTIILLLDLCKHPIPGIGVSRQARQHLEALAHNDCEVRTEATSYLISSVIASPQLTFELIEGGGIEQLTANMNLRSSEHKLARLSFAAFTVIADTHAGCQKFARAGLLSTALQSLSATNPLYLYSVLRFIEVAAQREVSAITLYDSEAIPQLVQFVKTFSKNNQLRSLCLPALSAIKHIALTLPQMKVRIRQTIAGLSKLHRKDTLNSSGGAAVTGSADGGGDISVADFLNALPAISKDHELDAAMEELLTLCEQSTGIKP